MIIKTTSFKLLPDGERVITEEKEFEFHSERKKVENKRPRKTKKTPYETPEGED